MVSSYRPIAPIIATTSDPVTYRQMSLVWGVYPLLNRDFNTTDDVIDTSVQLSLGKDLISIGDLVVITAGVPVGQSGTTNLLRVHVVTKNLVKGVGVGYLNVSGTARVLHDAQKDIYEGEIIVTTSTDIDMISQIKKASAIITEEGGLTSHAAIVGLSLGIPVIVSAKNATVQIQDGDTITVDATTGTVYKGEIKNL